MQPALQKYYGHSSNSVAVSMKLTLNANAMSTYPHGTIAVIFMSQRTGNDDAGYQSAAAAMEMLAKAQNGYCGIDSVRNADGLGITVSYWQNDDAAIAWRDHPEHAAIRDAGRDRWYSSYSLHVANIERSYDWAVTR